MKQQVRDFQHESLRIEVFNRNTNNTFIVIAQRDLACNEHYKTKGRAVDELYILAAGDQGPKSMGIALQTMAWSVDFVPPFLTDVLHLLHLTSQTLIDRYTTESDCYRFAVVGFLAIARFRSQVSYGMSLCQAFKMSSFFGKQLLDTGKVCEDVISVLVKFFEK